MPDPSTPHDLVHTAYHFIQSVRRERALQPALNSLADLEALARARGIEVTVPALRKAFRHDWLLRRLAEQQRST